MKIVARAGRPDLAMVYLAEDERGRCLEFVESLQPPFSREEKWVLIVSTLYGCPVRCPFCDAGSQYQGRVSADDLWKQIDFLVRSRYPEGRVPVKKFKIQFARLGEPAYNPAVLEVLAEMPRRLSIPGLLPSLSTVAPRGREVFFDQLLYLKRDLYPESFQLQFSLHSSDQACRDRLVPVRKWSFAEIAAYGERFFDRGGRKLTLNFALGRDIPLDAEELARHFSPEYFLVKITPVNPTVLAQRNRIGSALDEEEDRAAVLEESLKKRGYQVIISIGERAENAIGSNCGQFVNDFRRAGRGEVPAGYELWREAAEAEPAMSV